MYLQKNIIDMKCSTVCVFYSCPADISDHC